MKEFTGRSTVHEGYELLKKEFTVHSTVQRGDIRYTVQKMKCNGNYSNIFVVVVK